MCDKCGLFILSPYIDEQSLAMYYGEIYHPLILGVPSGVVLKDLVEENKGKDIFEFVQGQLCERQEITVCEIGCASGENLKVFSSEARKHGINCELWGTEYEKRYAAEAERKGINISVGDVESLDKHGKVFDVIILSHILEHFADANQELQRIKKLLKEDGFLYIEVPGVMNLKAYGNDLVDYLVHAHNYNFNLSSLCTLLELNGFKLVRGNEKIQALFRKDVTGKAEGEDVNNACLLKDYLYDTETSFRKNMSVGRHFKRYIWQKFYALEHMLVTRKLISWIEAFCIK